MNNTENHKEQLIPKVRVPGKLRHNIQIKRYHAESRSPSRIPTYASFSQF